MLTDMALKNSSSKLPSMGDPGTVPSPLDTIFINPPPFYVTLTSDNTLRALSAF